MSVTTSAKTEEELIRELSLEFDPLATDNTENDHINGEKNPEYKTKGEKIPGVLVDTHPTHENRSDENIRYMEDFEREENEQDTHDIGEENEAEVYCKSEHDALRKENDEGHTDTDEENDSRRCEPCLFDEIEEPAVAFCVVCIEYLCNSCARDHRRSKLTRRHKVLDDNEMPRNSSVFKTMKSMTSCPDHQEVEVSYICEQHEKFICTACLAVNHRKCEEVREISTELMSFTTGDTKIPLTDTLQSIYDRTVSVRTVKEENVKKMHLDLTNIMKEQSAYIQSLQELLITLGEKSKEETVNLMKKELEALEKEIVECKTIERSEIKQKELLDVAVKYGSMVELNVISALTMNRVNHFKDETEKQSKIPSVQLAFNANQEFLDISSIGKAFVKGDENAGLQNENPVKQSTLENSSDIIDNDDVDNVHIKTTETNFPEKKPLMQGRISRTRTMHDLRQYGQGTKCSINRVLILSDGRFIVTDHNNQSISVLNSDFTLNFVFKVNGEPIDMCKTSSSNLAVVFDGKKMVSRYIVGEDTIYGDGRFISKLFPISIDTSQESYSQVVILFSNEERKTPKRSDNDTIEIQIRNVQSGTIVRQLTGFKSKSSHTLVLEDTCRIRVIPRQQQTFLISEHKKLLCFERDNANALKVNWFYKSYRDNIIEDISDIATDNEGNIYVCGKGSKNIHQISGRNFKHNRVILSVPGIPLSICVDDDRRLLIIGCENDDFIYVASFD